MHDGQIAVRAHVIRFGRQDRAEVLLGGRQVAGIQGVLAALKDLAGVLRPGVKRDKR